MKHNFVDSKHNCRSEILLHIWKVKVNLKYNFEGLKNSDMVKHELQVTSCNLLVTRSKLKSSSWSLELKFKSASSNPRVTSSKSQVTNSNPQVTSSNSRVTSSNPRVTSSNPQVTSSNSQVASSNPRVTSSNPQVTSSNLRVTSSNPRVQKSLNQWKFK